MRLASALLLASAVSGCLEIPSEPGQECRASDDCGDGEVCHQGLCYGNPPPGTFAATLSATSTREELAPTELDVLTLPADGDLGALQLEPPVTISGRVEAFCPSAALCDATSIAAEVRLVRPARFPGGPALRFSAQSKPDMARGTDSFTLRVPRTHPGDPPYVVTIDPAGGGDMPTADGSTAPAERVAPLRLLLSATDDREHQTFTLGGPDDPVISGALKDEFQQPLVGYRVVALGRWSAESPVTEVSTIDFSTDGTFSLKVAKGALGPLELVARPFGPTAVGLELHAAGVGVYSQQRNLIRPLGAGAPVELAIPIEGLSSDGQVRPVRGARVIVAGALDAPYPGATRALLAAETTTGEDGLARLAVLDGPALTSSLRLRVIPPASSNLGIVQDSPVVIGDLRPVRLPSRIALSGVLVDSRGEPLGGVAVTARRSVRFLWSLPPADQTFLDEIPAATSITPDSGEFVLWVDPAVGGVWGAYDLAFDPPVGASAPDWVRFELEIPRIVSQATVGLGTISLPEASRARATVVDVLGDPVEGSSLRVYQKSHNDEVCAQVAFEPEGCPPTWLPIASGESGQTGVIQLALPRP